MNNYNNNYVKILNFLRAIACLGVCAVHLHYMTELGNNTIAAKIFNLGQQGVAIFFVISGFVIPYSLWNTGYEIKNFFRYLLKRIVRIDPPYVVVILISLVIIGYQTDVVRLLLHIGYLIPFSGYEWYQSVFWTLGIEFQFYILIGVLFPFIKNGNIYIVVSLLLGISLVGYFLPIVSDFKFISRYIHYFCFGIVCCLCKQGKVNIWVSHLFFVILTTYLSVRVSYTTGLIGYFAASCILHLNFKTIISDFLGKISYSLYLTHSLMAGLLINILYTYTLNAYILFAFLLCTCIIFATAFYFVAEKPALAYSKKIKN